MIILSKRIILFILSIVVALCPVCAYADDISASAYIVMDADSGAILSERNAYSPMKMASTTKIMTCLLACESGKLDDIVSITSEMLDGVYGSLVYVNAGDTITLCDLVWGAMLPSGNDAANAIAVYLAGSVKDFVTMMNNRAEEIGMKDTLFVTPSGLDERNHHSTAYDMALLSCVAMKNKELSKICCKSSGEITVNDEKRTVYNHNKLLGFDKCFVGLKTGYTDKAGRCLVSAYDYEGNIIVTVTLNAPDDWNDHKKLVKSVKSKYKEHKDTPTFSVSVVGGVSDSVECYLKYNIISINNIDVRCYYYPFVYAPVCAGDKVGIARIYKNKELVKTVEITAKEDVELWQTTT